MSMLQNEKVMTKKKKVNVKCPQCSKVFSYYDSEARPFCAERCKLIDLGHWLDGNYTMPSEEPLSESDIETIIKEQGLDEG